MANYSVNSVKAGINYHFNWGNPGRGALLISSTLQQLQSPGIVRGFFVPETKSPAVLLDGQERRYKCLPVLL